MPSLTMITPETFRRYLESRRSETLGAIARDLGTSRQAVAQWIAGKPASGPAMRVVELLMERDTREWP